MFRITNDTLKSLSIKLNLHRLWLSETFINNNRKAQLGMSRVDLFRKQQRCPHSIDYGKQIDTNKTLVQVNCGHSPFVMLEKLRPCYPTTSRKQNPLAGVWSSHKDYREGRKMEVSGSRTHPCNKNSLLIGKYHKNKYQNINSVHAFLLNTH